MDTATAQARALKDGIITKNRIELKNGYEGIHIRKCDFFSVTCNTISGEVYYGIRVSGRKKPGLYEMKAYNNTIEGNDMISLKIREPDNYSKNHADSIMFVRETNEITTAHYWLDSESSENIVYLKDSETVIDEGENNTINYQE